MLLDFVIGALLLLLFLLVFFPPPLPPPPPPFPRPRILPIPPLTRPRPHPRAPTGESLVTHFGDEAGMWKGGRKGGQSMEAPAMWNSHN